MSLRISMVRSVGSMAAFSGSMARRRSKREARARSSVSAGFQGEGVSQRLVVLGLSER
jgi:hypothetical protein